MNRSFNLFFKSIKHWELSFIIGCLYVLTGSYLLFISIKEFIFSGIFFSLFILMSGICEIKFAISNKNHIPCWKWYLSSGILDIFIGLLLINMPSLYFSVIPYLLIIWLFLRGLSGIAHTIEQHTYNIENWKWDLALSLFMIISSFALFSIYIINILSFIFIIANIFMYIGIFRIVLSTHLKKTIWGENISHHI